MNLIDRLHGGRKTATTADKQETHPAMPSFIVRHYDLLWRVLSMGRAEQTHLATLELAEFQTKDDVLDIGCGTGALILAAEQRLGATGKLVGLDVEPGMIAQAKAKADKLKSSATFAQGEITAIPYPDNSFDVVTSSLMLHHVPEEEHAAGFAELHRVIRPGGRVVVADINLAQRSSVSRAHGVRQPTTDTVQRDVPSRLEAAGFEVLRSGKHRLKALSYVVAEKAQ